MKEIVIKIPDKIYNDILAYRIYCSPRDVPHEAFKAIRKGKVLPPRHGELKDTNKIINDGISKGFCDWYDEIKYAEVLVEADKGDTDENK